MPFLQVMQLASNWGNQSVSRKQLIESSITLFSSLHIQRWNRSQCGAW